MEKARYDAFRLLFEPENGWESEAVATRAFRDFEANREGFRWILNIPENGVPPVAEITPSEIDPKQWRVYPPENAPVSPAIDPDVMIERK